MLIKPMSPIFRIWLLAMTDPSGRIKVDRKGPRRCAAAVLAQAIHLFFTRLRRIGGAEMRTIVWPAADALVVGSFASRD